MMTDVELQVTAFFKDFEQAAECHDWAHFEQLFLPEFLNADPVSAGVISCGDLIAHLPHRKHIFDRAGASGTRLVTLEIQQLDDTHVLAKTAWEVVFEHRDRNSRQDSGEVLLRSTFLLRRVDRWRIAVYLNHGNLLELLGLV